MQIRAISSHFLNLLQSFLLALLFAVPADRTCSSYNAFVSLNYFCAPTLKNVHPVGRERLARSQISRWILIETDRQNDSELNFHENHARCICFVVSIIHAPVSPSPHDTTARRIAKAIISVYNLFISVFTYL